MEVDPNDIVFEEDSHTYTRNGANYISVVYGVFAVLLFALSFLSKKLNLLKKK